MVFQYSFIDIVIKRSALENVKKGLSADFITEYKVEEGHYDEHLIIIRGGMSEWAAQYKINALATKYNLIHLQNGIAQDMVCTLRGDICSKCFWLKSGKLQEKIKIGRNKDGKYDTKSY